MLSPYEIESKEIQERIERKNQLEELKKGFRLADIFINRDYLDLFSEAEIINVNNIIKNNRALRIFEVKKLVFDPKEDVLDKLMSVYNTIYNLSASVAIILKSNKSEVGFYVVVRSDESPQLAGDMVKSALIGNFPGIKLNSYKSSEQSEFIKDIEKGEDGRSLLNGLATVSLVPAVRDEKKEQFVQGMEKLIYTLQGKEYLGIFLATPLDNVEINERRHGLEELHSYLTPHSKFSYAYGENKSLAVNRGISTSFTQTMNRSVSNTTGTSNSESSGTSNTTSRGGSFGGGSHGEGGSSNWGFNYGRSEGSTYSYTSGSSFSNSISDSVGKSDTESENRGETATSGNSETKTLNFENKGVMNLIQRLDQSLERINLCESYGLWESCAYFFSDEISTAVMAAATYKAIMTGEKTSVEKAHINIWDGNRRQGNDIKKILEYVKYLKHPRAEIVVSEENKEIIGKQYVSPTSLIGGNELAILSGLPRKSVQGVAVQEMAEFGRAVVYENKIPEKTISIGNIYHMGIEEKLVPVTMDVDLFASHCFITGSSGSGKSYATYNLLGQLLRKGINMLVIEPAKGEYKTVFGNLKKVNIFTTNTGTYRILKINPFQFPETIHILSHIEQVLQIFNAAWPLYAAMPAILKEAVVKAYVKCGWDILNSIWIEGISDHKYPVFQDVMNVLPEIINTSDYSADSKGDYKGALLTRVQAMTTGMNGLIFRKSEGIEDSALFDENTLIDLSEVGSDETIALIMGILIMRLNEYRKSKRKLGIVDSHDSGLTHITVLEEAHNLLKRTSKDQNQEGANLVGKSVEMISNSIKEMRTYGEGFMIIDQSPLAVDSSAIENTATKIILNTPSKEACEELGSALSLDENQIKELARLNVGVAAVLQKGWLTPVLMKVGFWDPSIYEKELQYENKSIEKYVRSEMVKEILNQIRNNSFVVRNVSIIIRNSKLSMEQKKDFEDYIELFQQFKNRSVKLSNRMLGKLFIEIIGCDALFDVIPVGKILTGNRVSVKCENKSKEEVDNCISEQINDAGRWIVSFCNALDKYIVIKGHDKKSVVSYMLAEKGKEGENGIEIYGWLYQMLEYLKWEDFIEMEE